VAVPKEITMNGSNRTERTWKKRLGLAAAVVLAFVLGAETGGGVDLADWPGRGGEKDPVGAEPDPESEIL
jgi:hypothetical protein